MLFKNGPEKNNVPGWLQAQAKAKASRFIIIHLTGESTICSFGQIFACLSKYLLFGERRFAGLSKYLRFEEQRYAKTGKYLLKETNCACAC